MVHNRGRLQRASLIHQQFSREYNWRSVGGDQVGDVVVLSDGNYVVVSPRWTNGTVMGAGAVTWCDGTSGCVGLVSPENSLVGSTQADWVGGRSVIPVENGNYVVLSPGWNNNQVVKAGAATWCNGAGNCAGEVSESNSLVGSTAGDQVGGSVVVLENGSYVVSSIYWANDAIPQAGAVTWCSGSGGCSGPVSSTNSLVGSHANDQIGWDGVIPLKNGNYIVGSSGWDNGSLKDAGAVTWCSGATGCLGEVTFGNSLVGSAGYDAVGMGGIRELSDGSYVVFSPFWANGTAEKAGAVTWCGGTANCYGVIFPANSVIGLAAGGQVSSSFAFDSLNHQLVVGRPADNRVTLLRTNVVHRVYLPLLRR